MNMARVQAFVDTVKADLAKGEICIMYAIPGDYTGPFATPEKIWPEMADPEFRRLIQGVLPGGRFSEPDELDGWTYVHYPRSMRDVS